MESVGNREILDNDNAKNEKERWYPHGEQVIIRGYEICDPLVFVTDARSSLISSCITLQSPVGKYNSNTASPSYIPSYNQLTKEQKAVYLHWLASGKKAQVDLQYVMLYSSGIQYRILQEGTDAIEMLHEYRILCSEFTIAHQYMARHMQSILFCLIGHAGIHNLKQEWYDILYAEIQLGTNRQQEIRRKVLLAWLYTHEKPLPGELAFHLCALWVKLKSPFRNSTIVHRHRDMFLYEFLQRYESIIGEVRLTSNAKYQLTAGDWINRIQTTIPDVSLAESGVLQLSSLWNELIDETKLEIRKNAVTMRREHKSSLVKSDINIKDNAFVDAGTVEPTLIEIRDASRGIEDNVSTDYQATGMEWKVGSGNRHLRTIGSVADVKSIPQSIKPSDIPCLKKLCISYHLFLLELVVWQQWTKANFDDLAQYHRVSSIAAISEINHWSLAYLGDMLIEEHSCYVINTLLFDKSRPHIDGAIRPAKQKYVTTKVLDKSRWYSHGDRVVINGYEINDPLVYVINGNRSTIPSCITMKSPIGQPNKAEMGPSHIYRYAQFTKDQKATYLRWLSNGKRSPIDSQYVLMYFSGIRDRILQVGNTEKELLYECFRIRREFTNLSSEHIRFIQQSWLCLLGHVGIEKMSNDWFDVLMDELNTEPFRNHKIIRKLLLAWLFTLQRHVPGQLAFSFCEMFAKQQSAFKKSVIVERQNEWFREKFLDKYEKIASHVRLVNRGRYCYESKDFNSLIEVAIPDIALHKDSVIRLLNIWNGLIESIKQETRKNGITKDNSFSCESANKSSYNIVIDPSKLETVFADTRDASAYLAPIFAIDDNAPQFGEDELTISATNPLIQSLDPRLHCVLYELIRKERWTREAFASLARQHSVMPIYLMETVNNWADEHLGDLLIEDGDPYKINVNLLEEVTWS